MEDVQVSLNPVTMLATMRTITTNMTGTRTSPNIVTRWNNSEVHTGTDNSLNITLLSGLQNSSSVTTYAHTNDHTWTGENKRLAGK